MPVYFIYKAKNQLLILAKKNLPATDILHKANTFAINCR